VRSDSANAQYVCGLPFWCRSYRRRNMRDPSLAMPHRTSESHTLTECP
jgi:hypothetical protein